MGRGRKPVPHHLRLAKGTNAKNSGRENPHGLEQDGEIGNPPDHLSAAEKDTWREFEQHYFDRGDRGQYEAFCVAMSDARRFHAECVEDGFELEDTNGKRYRNPALISYEKAAAFANKIACEFGMNPTAKNKVRIPPKPSEDPGAKFFKSS